MKILKLVQVGNRYSVIFDKIPSLKYEKVGHDYIGTVVNEEGQVVFSRVLGFRSYGGAFGGSEITIKMADGTDVVIKDNWYDEGSYKKHGEFINIGANTIKELQNCYVYFSCNINKQVFMRMVEEYLKKDRVYGSKEIQEWLRLKHKWHNVKLNGKDMPFKVNKYGQFIHKQSLKSLYPRFNKNVRVKGKWFKFTLFKVDYIDENNHRVRIEAKMIDVLKESLPYTEKYIRKMCKL